MNRYFFLNNRQPIKQMYVKPLEMRYLDKHLLYKENSLGHTIEVFDCYRHRHWLLVRASFEDEVAFLWDLKKDEIKVNPKYNNDMDDLIDQLEKKCLKFGRVSQL